MLLVTGAPGFLGSAVVREVVRRGQKVRAMTRATSSLELLEPQKESIEIVQADMADAASLDAALQDVDAVVHCAATTSSSAPDLEISRKVNVEGTRALIEAMRKHGARRLINISSQSAHPDNPSVYGQTKLEQDEVVQASEGIDWTILRPSIIYGPEEKGIFHKMVQHCRKLPAIPIIGSGKEEMRPVHVDDVAIASLDCIAHDATIGQIYDIGGADVLAFKDFIGELLKALDQKKMRVHLPIPIAMLLARTLSLLMKNPPLTPDNVTGISTVKHVDISAAQRDFNFAPRKFTDGLNEIFKS
ncbi:SDR family NAD(P)-dependent oxidoreductase [Candidatus Sumerlaeota bacterium]|nr:SDR family NAD(P)-dependent oxidoreductase [Candidatus Sumerlaeota bacterium]